MWTQLTSNLFAPFSVGVLEFSKCVERIIWCDENELTILETGESHQWWWVMRTVVAFVRSSYVNETNYCVERNMRWKNSHQNLSFISEHRNSTFESATKHQFNSFGSFPSIHFWFHLHTNYTDDWVSWFSKNTKLIEIGNHSENILGEV